MSFILLLWKTLKSWNFKPSTILILCFTVRSLKYVLCSRNVFRVCLLSIKHPSASPWDLDKEEKPFFGQFFAALGYHLATLLSFCLFVSYSSLLISLWYFLYQFFVSFCLCLGFTIALCFFFIFILFVILHVSDYLCVFSAFFLFLLLSV